MVKETELQGTVCDYLALKNRCFWRVNNIPAVYTDHLGQRNFRRLPKYTPRGLPDIIVVKAGIIHCLELKGAEGKQSPEQKVFEQWIKEHGGVYAVVRSLEDVMKLGL